MSQKYEEIRSHFGWFKAQRNRLMNSNHTHWYVLPRKADDFAKATRQNLGGSGVLEIMEVPEQCRNNVDKIGSYIVVEPS